MTEDMRVKPVILVVDDEADRISAGLTLRLDQFASVNVMHPSEFTYKDVLNSDLILVDYRLDFWSEREQHSLAFNIRSGMGLAAVLREISDEARPDRVTAVALHTAHLSEASGRIRPPHSNHIVARLNNLEWVFEKNSSTSEYDPYNQVAELASVVQQLREEWPAEVEASEAHARTLLRLNDETEWSDRSWSEVKECQPPIYELISAGRSILFVRWLLQQILPYPCFLWDAHQVAARLKLSTSTFASIIRSNSKLSSELEPMRYKGILRDFLGDRWWRTAIEDYSWKLAAPSSGDLARYKDHLYEKTGVSVPLLEFDDPIVCLDHQFQPTEISTPREAVRLRPDYWPPFADTAWMKIETVGTDSLLRNLVDPSDQYRLVDE